MLVAAATLAACMPQPPALPPDSACGAPELQGLVGQPAAVLQTMRFGVQVRILRPGDAMTEDYSPARLNIMIDAVERIAEVRCG
jgi:hypothetical protein